MDKTPPPLDIQRALKDDHQQILALFRQYLALPPDSRQSIVDQILHRLSSHLEREEALIFNEIRMSGQQGQQLIGNAEMEHEEVKTMIHDLQESEADDDQEMDEAFEDMMQTVRAHFITEERDLFPLVKRSSGASPL